MGGFSSFLFWTFRLNCFDMFFLCYFLHEFWLFLRSPCKNTRSKNAGPSKDMQVSGFLITLACAEEEHSERWCIHARMSYQMLG